MFAEHAAAHLHTPYFALQSAYDSWQTAHVQGPGGDEKTRVLGKNISGRATIFKPFRGSASGLGGFERIFGRFRWVYGAFLALKRRISP